MSMIAAEEFTFPVIRSSRTADNLALLPPLWRISECVDPNQAGKQRRTFASQAFKVDDAAEKGEGAGSGSGAAADSELQEKMDLLWEDFNEELQSTAASSDSDFSEETIQHRDSNNSFENLEECANVRQLKLIPTKPKKLESLVKVMKKLFSPQNTVRSNQQKRRD